MRHIAPILQGVLSRAHLQQGLSNYSVFSCWSEVVGPMLAPNTRPLRMQGSTLWVYVDNATLRHHMTFLIPQILDRIREHAPSSHIEQVRFTLNPENEHE